MSEPITVNAGTAPEVVTTIARYLVTFVGGWIVAKGWITADQLPQVAGVILGAVPLIWGAWSAFRNKSKLITTAEAAPNNVAVVK